MTQAVTPVTTADPAQIVVMRLEEAGATLLAIPYTGYSTKLQTGSLDIVRTAIEAYGWSDAAVRPRRPTPEEVSGMDEAFAWLRFIPPERYVLRRIVGARALVHPLSDKHLFSWRRLGEMLRSDYRAVQRWHGEAIDLIVRELHRRKFNFSA